MAPLRTAVVGCGRVGAWKHLPALDRHPAVDLVAVCDADESRLREATDGYDVARYASSDELTAAEDLDSAHVCTPPQTHRDVARELLEAGVPVLLEKPAATSAREVDDIAAAADRAGLPVSVVHNKLFVDPVRRAREAVARGAVGDVRSVTMLFAEPPDDTVEKPWMGDLPGGKLGEGLPHQVYLPLAFVAGVGEVRRVTEHGSGRGVALEAVDATGDRVVGVRALVDDVPHQDLLVVQGTDGELRVDLWNGVVTTGGGDGFVDRLALNGLDAAARHAVAAARNVATTAKRRWKWRSDEWYPDRNGHYRQIDAHVRALRAGEDPPVPLADARDTMTVLDALGAELAAR